MPSRTADKVWPRLIARCPQVLQNNGVVVERSLRSVAISIIVDFAIPSLLKGLDLKCMNVSGARALSSHRTVTSDVGFV